jgi:hypothetical protein
VREPISFKGFFMFKKFAVLCVILCMGLAMAGCSGKKASEPPKDNIEPPKDQPAAAAAESIEAPK